MFDNFHSPYFHAYKVVLSNLLGFKTFGDSNFLEEQYFFMNHNVLEGQHFEDKNLGGIIFAWVQRAQSMQELGDKYVGGHFIVLF